MTKNLEACVWVLTHRLRSTALYGTNYPTWSYLRICQLLCKSRKSTQKYCQMFKKKYNIQNCTFTRNHLQECTFFLCLFPVKCLYMCFFDNTPDKARLKAKQRTLGKKSVCTDKKENICALMSF